MPQLADVAVPVIVSMEPEDDSVLASEGTTIQITFNEAILPASAADKITLLAVRDSNAVAVSSPVPGAVSVSSNVVTSTLSSKLEAGDTYEVTLAAGLKDLSGNPVPSAKTWTFSTPFDKDAPNKVGDDSGRITVSFGANAFSEEYGVKLSDPLTDPKEISLSAVKAAVNKGAVRQGAAAYLAPGAIAEINVYSKSGARLRTPNARTTIVFKYPDSDQDGYVDGMRYRVKEEDLSIYWLDELTESFVKLPASAIDPAANTASVLLPHFSVFAFMGAADTSLSNVHPFPVPFVPSRGDTSITFTGLSAQAAIRVYTITGELVQALDETDGDGRYVWDTTNQSGEKLASGVYIYKILSPTESKTGKLMIVR